MKLRTSFCNPGVIRKDITRFAPLWGIYLAGGLLVMLTSLANTDPQYAARNLASTIGPFSVINMLYAALCAQMLFGDLYNARMCNALHATPLRREAWYFSHVFSGLLFSVVPHTVCTLLLLPLLKEIWVVAWLWLLAMVLEFLLFFGVAVFSALCAGNRLAMAAVYGILNFASLIVYWFVTSIYEPMLFGIAVSVDPFLIFCPVAAMTRNVDLLIFERIKTWQNTGMTWQYQGLGSGWGYLILCAVLGIVFLGVALLLYRRRKLECAGNFMAVKGLEPIFAVVFALCTGGVFSVFGQIFENEYLIYLIVGLVIGWFVGQMLLRRTVKVFQWKTFAKLGILGLALGATLLLTHLDPMGITRWVPAPEKVAKVELCTGTVINTNSENYVQYSTQEDIQQFIDAHKQIVSDGPEAGKGKWTKIIIRYQMQNGRQVSRYYTIYEDSEAWDALRYLYDSPKTVLGYEDRESFLNAVEQLNIQGYTMAELCRKYVQKHGKALNADAIQKELAEAIWADAEAKNLPQKFMKDVSKGYLEIRYKAENGGYSRQKHILYYAESSNVLAWISKYTNLIIPQ